MKLKRSALDAHSRSMEICCQSDRARHVSSASGTLYSGFLHITVQYS